MPLFSILNAVLLTLAFEAVKAGEIQVTNNCDERIFVLNEGGNIGGFHLVKGQSQAIQLRQDASSRVWAHVGCDDEGKNCDTAEGYVSLAEMKWDDTAGMIGFTWYDISQVDGYNLPIIMQPYVNSGGNCETVGCNFNIDANCPTESKIYKDGRVVACQNPNRDSPDTEYSRAMEAACNKNVYTWSDDFEGMRACEPGNSGLTVIFC